VDRKTFGIPPKIELALHSEVNYIGRINGKPYGDFHIMAKPKTIVTPALTAEQITAMVDKIGDLKAQIAKLESQYNADVNVLKAMGTDRYYGELFEVNVFDQTQSRLDMEAVRAKLSPQFIAAHTTTKDVRVAKVTARLIAKSVA